MDTIKTIQELLKSNGSVQSVMVRLTEKDKNLIASAPELLEIVKMIRENDALMEYIYPKLREDIKEAIAKHGGGG